VISKTKEVNFGLVSSSSFQWANKGILDIFYFIFDIYLFIYFYLNPNLFKGIVIQTSSTSRECPQGKLAKILLNCGEKETYEFQTDECQFLLILTGLNYCPKKENNWVCNFNCV
jgi:hypothetical protein